MAEPAMNPYAPPRAPVGDMPSPSATPAPQGATRLPVVLLLRWVLSAALVALGLWRTLVLWSNWHYFADSAIIDPTYNPWPRLAIQLSIVAVGLLLGLRSRWLFVPLFLHTGLFARQVFNGLGNFPIPEYAYVEWSVELLVFGFCAWLALRGRLK